jgi:hypothetical protein
MEPGFLCAWCEEESGHEPRDGNHGICPFHAAKLYGVRRSEIPADDGLLLPELPLRRRPRPFWLGALETFAIVAGMTFGGLVGAALIVFVLRIIG